MRTLTVKRMNLFLKAAPYRPKAQMNMTKIPNQNKTLPRGAESVRNRREVEYMLKKLAAVFAVNKLQ